MCLKMEQYTKDSGEETTEKDLACKFGQMVPSTMGIGRTTKLMEGECSGMLMEMFLMGNGKKIKLMGTEYTHMLTGRSTKVIGRMISNMELVLNHGLMVQNMMENIKKE